MIREGIPGVKGDGYRSRNRGVLFLCILSAFACLFAGCAWAAGEEGVEEMKGRVLVAYETSKGSTAEVAETIAAEIRAAGWDAEAVDIKDLPQPEDYSHVIVGGPIYLGRIKGVRAFVDGHDDALRERLIGAFVVGMSFAVPDEEKQASGRKALDEAIAPLAPAHLGYFAGKIAVKMVKSPVGDFRDWDAVRNWTREVIKAVTRESGKP